MILDLYESSEEGVWGIGESEQGLALTVFRSSLF